MSDNSYSPNLLFRYTPQVANTLSIQWESTNERVSIKKKRWVQTNQNCWSFNFHDIVRTLNNDAVLTQFATFPGDEHTCTNDAYRIGSWMRVAKKRYVSKDESKILISKNSKNSSVSTSNPYLDSMMRTVGLFFIEPHVCVWERERQRDQIGWGSWIIAAALVPVHKINTPCHLEGYVYAMTHSYTTSKPIKPTIQFDRIHVNVY